MFSSWRVERNVTGIVMPVVCNSKRFPEDICDLHSEREPEFDGGEKLMFVSVKQVRESMKDGAQVFVMLDSLEAGGKGIICDLPAVCEFLELLPKDISDLPPKREVEYSIDLVPGTSMVSMTPYRMSASELGELKKQLEDLLKRKFVRLSVSPWGAPMFLVKKKKMVA